MIARLVVASAIACLVMPGLAVRPQASLPDIAGDWILTVKGPAAHGDLTATLSLTLDGRKVTGRLTAHGNEHTVAGEFVDGSLTLEVPDAPAGRALSITARLNDEGTLAGYISTADGDMSFTGKRKGSQPERLRTVGSWAFGSWRLGVGSWEVND
jgi:hypothetical protein